MENFNVNVDNLSTEEKRQLMTLISRANQGKKCIVISYKEEGETSFGTLKDRECFFSNGALYLKIFAPDLSDYNINCANAISIVEAGLTRFDDDELVVRAKITIEKKNLTQYEVAFVVQGYLKAEDGDIGELTCNGLVETDGVFYLKDGRWYYTVAAESPQEAYDQAVLDFEAACIGEIEITDWFLEHVSDEADNYWYREVLKV